MPAGHSSDEWIARYAASHQHPVNRFCHTIGIPLIVLSLALLAGGLVVRPLLLPAAALFVAGWIIMLRLITHHALG